MYFTLQNKTNNRHHRQIIIYPITFLLKMMFLKNKYHIFNKYIFHCGLGSSVGLATDYWLEDPGLNAGEDDIFRPSRPALGPTQPSVK